MAFRAIFMDAGQGDATLLKYPDGSAVLIDCGSKKNRDIVAGQINLVLDAQLPQTPGRNPRKRLKALVLTHPDGDHYNLVNEIIVDKDIQVESVFVGWRPADYTELDVWLGLQKTTYWADKGVRKAERPAPHHSGQVVDDLSYPGRGNETVEVRILAANVPATKNDGSIVLLVTYANTNLMLMGDATEVTESAILDMFKGQRTLGVDELLRDPKRRTFLKVGHHGSRTSSSAAWLAWVQPELAFVSSDTKAFGGRSSIPDKEVLDRIINLTKAGGRQPNYSLSRTQPTHYYVDYNRATQFHELAPDQPASPRPTAS